MKGSAGAPSRLGSAGKERQFPQEQHVQLPSVTEPRDRHYTLPSASQEKLVHDSLAAFIAQAPFWPFQQQRHGGAQKQHILCQILCLPIATWGLWAKYVVLRLAGCNWVHQDFYFYFTFIFTSVRLLLFSPFHPILFASEKMGTISNLELWDSSSQLLHTLDEKKRTPGVSMSFSDTNWTWLGFPCWI